MTKEQLQERINKLETKIEKTKKNKDKYYDQLSEEGKSIVNNPEYRNWMNRKNLNYSNYEEEIIIDSYFTKLFELEQFENTLNKYQNQIKALDDLIEIPVLREFLKRWKESAIEYYITLTDNYKKDIKKLHDEYFYESGKMKDGKTFTKYGDERIELTKIYGQYVCDVCDYNGSHKNEQIEKDMEKESQSKYKTLVNRISDLVGEIKNCKYLRIGDNGEINGIIEGNKSTAKIETIVAGGYNEHIIVNVKHGQCLHYRVLVKELD